MLVFLHPEDKPRTPEDIDKIVCAEMPDEEVNPLLHKLVKDKMIHGPCEGFNAFSPCCLNPNKTCEKGYPKSFQDKTSTSETGHTTYRRRSPTQGGHLTQKTIKDGQKVMLGNRWVVPYNPYLLLKYKTHINVEVCTTTASVKYLFKYVLKGQDKISLELVDENGQKNEVKAYEQGRYFDSTMSCHRIFGFWMCYRVPSVAKLQFHLENEQIVLMEEDGDPTEALKKFSKTQLTQFFVLNQHDERAHGILYPDIPKYYVWKEKKWVRRKQILVENDGNDDSPLSATIGRIPVVPLNSFTKEKFFLRVLLYHVTGPTSFQHLKTVILDDGQEYMAGE